MPYSRYLTSLIGGTISITALSATPFTDTGSIYRQIKDHADRSIERRSVEKTKKEQKLLVKGTRSVLVKGFKVIGNDEFSETEINSVLAPYLGQTMTTGELEQIAETLTKYYHDKGFFDESTAIISPYIVKNGIIVLVVDEKHLEQDGISVVNSGERIQTAKVLNLWNNTMKPGAMKQSDYERAMLLTNDFAGISAKADLYYGTKDNTDDLVITVTDEDVFNGNIDIDNFGSYYTGRTQVGTTLYWNSPTKHGEEIVARFITTGKYSNYGYLDVAVPVFDNGTRLGASIDFLDYELKHQLANQGGDGNVWNATAYAKYPIVRTEDFNVEAELDYVHTVMKDNNLTAEIDNTTLNKGVLKLSANRSDTFLLNGITYLDVSLTRGNVDLNDLSYSDLDALTTKTAGSYTKVNYSLSRYQNLVGDFSSKISVDGQWASKNLDTSEKYFLGGPYSMAGYPVGQIAGDDAFVFYADLRYDFHNVPWGGDFQVNTFYSYGWAKILKKPDDYVAYYSLDGENNEMTLQTVGLGFSQTWTEQAVVRVMVGKQIGTNEYRTISINNNLDYDQSDSDYRAWVEAIYYF